MIEIAVQNLKKYYGANEVLSNVHLELKTGERIGIVGKNGCGKSTLFKILAGIEPYDEGMVTFRKGIQIGYLDQLPHYPSEYTVEAVLKTAFENLINLSLQMKDLEAIMSSPNTTGELMEKTVNTYATIQHDYEALGGYEMDERINRIKIGLRFHDDFMSQPFHSLSGGEKTRVILARILLEDLDVLLLDEPTNHLDVASIEWLEDYLSTYKGSVVIVSHDRFFLDKVVTQVVEIENKESSLYHGNYSYYTEEKERRTLLQLEAYEQQQKKIKSMEEAIQRFRDWGTRADNEKFFKKAKSMEKRLDKMDKIDRPGKDRKMKLSLEASHRSGKEVLTIKELSKSFEQCLFTHLDLQVFFGDRVVLLGANGCGKTTLLQMVMSQFIEDHNMPLHGIKDIKQDHGIIKIGSRVKIGYHDQNVAFSKEDISIIDCFRDQYPMPEGEARQKLARFLFYGEDVFKKVHQLSGGEKSRLKLCLLLHQDVNFLVLDEPTNHLDMLSREILEEALLEYTGTILFVSHDRYFINKLSTRVMDIDNKELKTYEGDYAYYKEEVAKIKKNLITKTSKKTAKNVIPSSQNRHPDKEKEKLEKKRHEAIFQLESQIDDLEIQIETFKNMQVEHGQNYSKLAEIEVLITEAESKLDAAMVKWEKLQLEG